MRYPDAPAERERAVNPAAVAPHHEPRLARGRARVRHRLGFRVRVVCARAATPRRADVRGGAAYAPHRGVSAVEGVGGLADGKRGAGGERDVEHAVAMAVAAAERGAGGG